MADSYEMMVFTWKRLPKKAKKHIKAWVTACHNYIETMTVFGLVEVDNTPTYNHQMAQNDIRCHLALRYWWRGAQATVACEKWLPNGGGEKFGRWMLDREYGQQFPDPLWTEYNKDWDSLTEQEYVHQMMEIPT